MYEEYPRLMKKETILLLSSVFARHFTAGRDRDHPCLDKNDKTKISTTASLQRPRRLPQLTTNNAAVNERKQSGIANEHKSF